MRIAFFVACICLTFAITFGATERSQNDDLITSLPGLNFSVSFKQYAGYLTVDPSHGRKLFYWFVEAKTQADKAPLVLWLNGGPGCSSLIGFLSENGPFRPDDDGKNLFLDSYSWNDIANMLYLEAPAGVGFSYSNDPSDYNTGDDRTAADNYKALQLWFARFNQYQGRDFYIAGESYGGHYVPTLANQVVDGNKVSSNIKINLQGILVGNGLTVNEYDLNAFPAVYAYHSIIPYSLYTQMSQTCQGNYINNNNAQCNKFINLAQADIGNIDPYDIYAPVCNQQSKKKGYNPVRFPHPLMDSKAGDGPVFDPCIDLHLTEYLNREDVRKAIHADDAAGQWVECTGKINYNFSMAHAPSMVPYYQKFFTQANLRILIYSGDVDSVVPFLGTTQWIDSLNRPVTQPWRTWNLDKQVGGYVTVYDKLTFLTIRGAGHMVPYFKPAHAYTFFTRYINKQPF